MGVEAHEQAARAAGFREVLWHRPQVAPIGLMLHGADYWQTMVESPPIALIECRA